MKEVEGRIEQKIEKSLILLIVYEIRVLQDDTRRKCLKVPG